ncbi:DUF115 domain-containing protein [Candidatus Dojkabacteria bacterium]|jgi:hypothetical protein|nr:DUF115 domain-containing protein [Candidatus Dojkabacteria bacterium]
MKSNLKTLGKKIPNRLTGLKGFGKYYRRIESEVLYFKYRDTLALNSRFKDKYKNNRCFIVGNGPSLKTQDLTCLKNEYVFAVNNMVIAKEFHQTKPNFYAIGDSNFFYRENYILKKNIDKLIKQKNLPIFIFPVIHKNYIHEMGWDKEAEILYCLPGQLRGRVKSIDLTRLLPKVPNIINLTLYCAIYMGFTEIYLLGCDMTGFIMIHDKNKVIDGGHFYKEEGRLKKFVDNLNKSRANEFMLKSYGHVFEKFRQTFDYANARGIKIINLTRGGALDVFPRLKYEDVVKDL